MPRNRFLKYINLLMGVVLGLALIAGYWIFYRSLPGSSGEVTAPIRLPASAVRDKLGVPHIRAGCREDAFFLQGFLTAQDRFFQMDLGRRRGAGQLAEIFGPEALESDREARRLRLDRLAEGYARHLAPANRRWFAAYARGVNFYLERNHRRLPAEFRILGYQPRPWRLADSILIALNVFRAFSTSWREEVLKQSFLAEGDPGKAQRLFPAPAARPGSNAWVVAGRWTASGKPLLAADPHFPFGLPCPWYAVHLDAPGLDVIGAGIPGLPGVLVGHNRHIAWAATNLPFDVQDLYRERLDPATGTYLYQGRLRRAVRETEFIPVKGRNAVRLSYWVTVHGPVILSRGGLQLALRWTAAEPGPFAYPFLAIDQAQNWKQFRQALRPYRGPPLDFLYADGKGDIGSQVAGWLPRRRSYQGDVPVDGSSGGFEWDGFIPFDELPAHYNPSSGRIVSANQDPFPKDYPYRVSGDFAPGYRWHRIRQLLSGRRDWTAREMLHLQTDIYSAFLHFLAGQLVAAWDQRAENLHEPGLAPAVALLRHWDGRMDRRQAAPLIARLLYDHLRRSIAERVAPKSGLGYRVPMAPGVVARLLRERPPGWFPSYDKLLLDNFADAVAEARRMQGGNSRRWRYGRYNRFERATILDRVPILGSYFRLRPVTLSGGPTTVQRVARPLAPALRLVVDPADWDGSLMVLSFGESGQRFSRHFLDQWHTYQRGGAFRLRFGRWKAKGLFFRPALPGP